MTQKEEGAGTENNMISKGFPERRALSLAKKRIDYIASIAQ